MRYVRSERNSCGRLPAPVPELTEWGTQPAWPGGLQGQHRLSGVVVGAFAGSGGKVFEYFEILVSLTVVVF